MEALNYIGLTCMLFIMFCLGVYTTLPNEDKKPRLTRKQKAEYKRFQKLLNKSKKHYYKSVSMLAKANAARAEFICKYFKNEDGYKASSFFVDENTNKEDK